MKIKLRITRHTTESELIHLGAFVTALALNRGARVFAPPPDEAELDEPEHVAATPEQEAAIHAATGITPKRRRRTKAEIEAAAEAEERAQHTYDHARNQPPPEQEQGAIAPGEPGNDQPAPTPTAPETTSGAAEAPATAPPSDGKTYAASDVQQLATVVARTHGADLVKDKIKALGGARIADLTAGQLNELGNYLANVK